MEIERRLSVAIDLSREIDDLAASDDDVDLDEALQELIRRIPSTDSRVSDRILNEIDVLLANNARIPRDSNARDAMLRGADRGVEAWRGSSVDTDPLAQVLDYLDVLPDADDDLQLRPESSAELVDEGSTVLGIRQRADELMAKLEAVHAGRLVPPAADADDFWSLIQATGLKSDLAYEGFVQATERAVADGQGLVLQGSAQGRSQVPADWGPFLQKLRSLMGLPEPGDSVGEE